MAEQQQTPYTPGDPLELLLRRSPLNDRQRAGLWDIYETAVNTDDLSARLQSIEIPQEVKAKLWELKAQETAPIPSELKPGPEGSAVGRFGANLVEQLNPITMAQGLYNTVRHPIETGKAILGQQADQYRKAKAAEGEGRYSEMVGHSIAAAIPILGPAAAAAGEQIGSGDVAGGMGKATGVVGPAVAVGAMRGGTKNPARLQAEAEGIVAEKVLAPANAKYKQGAQEVAPELLKRGVSGDRFAIQQWAEDLISDAGTRIDDAIASYPATATLKTKPVLDMLDSTLKSMEFDQPTPPANPMQGVVTNAQGQPVRLPSKSAPPQVNPVLRGVYDSIKELRDFVAQRGPTMTFDDMRRLRQQLDGIGQTAKARAKVSGDMGLDAIERATSETGNALRRQIAAERPELAVPNADMHLGLTLRDVLDPLRGRPKTQVAQTGVTGGLSTAGAFIGSEISNIPGLRAIGAFIASDLLPRIRNAQLSPENQLRLAQDKYRLAEALRAGRIRPAQRIIQEMGIYVPGLTTGPAVQGPPQPGTR